MLVCDRAASVQLPSVPNAGQRVALAKAFGCARVVYAEAPTVDRRTGGLGGVARYALGADNARRLWTVSERLVHDGRR
jgi:hypothetical protein